MRLLVSCGFTQKVIWKFVNHLLKMRDIRNIIMLFLTLVGRGIRTRSRISLQILKEITKVY